ncbi:MAG: hypothetical protein QM766_06270 [Burkholderiaceae bacterium]
MTEPSFLGIDKPIWDLINGFANWLSAIGSIAAALMALYIANRSSKPSARLSVGHRIIIEQGQKGPFPEYLVFQIVNTGDRPITITSIGWKIGWPVRRHAMQLFEKGISSPLPVALAHGQQASWYVPMESREGGWFEYFAKDMLMPRHSLSLWLLKAQAFTTVGFVFSCSVEAGALRRMRESCEKVLQHES